MGFLQKLFSVKDFSANVSYEFGKNVVEDDNIDLLEEGIDYLFARFDREKWSKQKVYDSLPKWYGDIEKLWLFKSEVLNGGTYQYFCNSLSDGLPDLKRIFNEWDNSKIIQFGNELDDANKGFLHLKTINADDKKIDSFLEANHFTLDDKFYKELEELFYDCAHFYILKQLQKENSSAFPMPPHKN